MGRRETAGSANANDGLRAHRTLSRRGLVLLVALVAVIGAGGCGEASPLAPAPVVRDTTFHVTVQWVNPPTLLQQSVVEQAVARWERVIAGDLPDLPLTLIAGACAPGMPAFTGTVDDLLLFAVVDAFDGPGGLAGQAGPCVLRAGGRGLPAVAVLRLDAADFGELAARNLAFDLVLHELGHALGLGTLWTHDNGSRGLVQGLRGGDPRYVGARGWQAAEDVGRAGTTGVGVENEGGVGTIDVHWRESLFTNELMTGYLDPLANVLSPLTIAALEDLGYVVHRGAADGWPRLVTATPVRTASSGLHAVEASAPPLAPSWEQLILPHVRAPE